MFTFRIKDYIWMMFKTLFLVFILDFFSSSLFPTFQQTYFFPSFHILIIVFFSFFQPAERIPFLVLITASFHSIFTIEGWAVGTITGLIVANILVLIKDTIQFSSFIATFLMVYAIQVFWSLILGTLLSIKLENWYILKSYLSFSLVQGIILGIVALPIFKLLEKIWAKDVSSSYASDQVL